MRTLSLAFLAFFSACYAIGRYLKAGERKEDEAKAMVRRAASLAADGQAHLFDAVQTNPKFDRPVLVWKCEGCDRFVFVAQDCPSCTRPMPEHVPAVWAREADVITQTRRRP